MQSGARVPTDTELLSTLFELGREVTSVLDLEELLAKIPQLIARLTRFSAFSVYLLDEKTPGASDRVRRRLSGGWRDIRLRIGQGVVGAAVAGRPADPGQRHSRASRATGARCATCSRSWPSRFGARAR